MEKVLTIVVPSYNTERYVDACLPNMLDERFIQEVEILLIDDGSTDSTNAKLKKYEQKFPDSIRVITKENGGHGSVINRGIIEAKGRYFRVIDGDDTIIADNMVKLIDGLRENDVDLVFQPLVENYINIGEQKKSCLSELEEWNVYQFDKVAKLLNAIPLHSLNYKTKVLQANNVRVRGKCYYEDKEYMLYPIPYIKTIMYFNLPVYIYNIGVEGQSISPEKVVKNWKMLKAITKDLCSFYESEVEKGISNPKREYLSRAICDVIKNTYGMFLKMPHGRATEKLISKFNAECKEWSQKLYEEGNSGVVKLLRKDNYFIYSVAYGLFKRQRKKRGF